MKRVLLAAAMIGLTSGAASATTATFDVSTGGYTLGSGFGTGSGQLDMTANYTLGNPAPFVLNNGQSKSYNFGSLSLNETNIAPNETDNLSLTVFLKFVLPNSATATDVAVTSVYTGPVDDPALDLKFVFDPVTIAFAGGTYTVSWSEIDFYYATDCWDSNIQTVKITYNDPPASVPEPASFGLLGLGLIGMTRLRRRRAG